MLKQVSWRSLPTLLFPTFLSLALTTEIRIANAEPNCLTGNPQTESYMLRGDICEGIVDKLPGETNIGSFRITSFSLGRLQQLTTLLLCRIPKTDSKEPSEVRIQSVKEKYLIDQLKLPSDTTERTFNTAGLKKAGITASEVRTLSWISSGTQFYYVPILLEPKAKEYSLVFFSSKPVAIPKIQIVRKKDRAVVFHEARFDVQSSPEIFVNWKNPQKSAKGYYELQMTIQQEGKKQREESFVFYHDPQWFK